MLKRKLHRTEYYDKFAKSKFAAMERSRSPSPSPISAISSQVSSPVSQSTSLNVSPDQNADKENMYQQSSVCGASEDTDEPRRSERCITGGGGDSAVFHVAASDLQKELVYGVSTHNTLHARGLAQCAKRLQDEFIASE